MATRFHRKLSKTQTKRNGRKLVIRKCLEAKGYQTFDVHYSRYHLIALVFILIKRIQNMQLKYEPDKHHNTTFQPHSKFPFKAVEKGFQHAYRIYNLASQQLCRIRDAMPILNVALYNLADSELNDIKTIGRKYDIKQNKYVSVKNWQKQDWFDITENSSSDLQHREMAFYQELLDNPNLLNAPEEVKLPTRDIWDKGGEVNSPPKPRRRPINRRTQRKRCPKSED